jgi:hypothetical protein
MLTLCYFIMSHATLNPLLLCIHINTIELLIITYTFDCHKDDITEFRVYNILYSIIVSIKCKSHLLCAS